NDRSYRAFSRPAHDKRSLTKSGSRGSAKTLFISAAFIFHETPWHIGGGENAIHQNLGMVEALSANHEHFHRNRLKPCFCRVQHPGGRDRERRGRDRISRRLSLGRAASN